MKHPNRTSDPDCTSPNALEAALEMKIAAESYGEVVTYLDLFEADTELPVGELRQHLEEIHRRVTEKYTKLRDIIKET